MSKYLLLLLFLCSLTVNAKLYQSSGEAFIVNNEIDLARNKAIKEAAKNALIFSGGAISSLQQVSNGVLVENKLILKSKGEIADLTLLEEIIEDNRIWVKINVNIKTPQTYCQGSNYPKSISITRFKLNNPQQAVDGHLHRVNRQVTQTLYNQLKLSPQNLNVRELVDIPVQLGHKYNQQSISDTLIALATQTDSQYIIYGEINDLSVDFGSKNSIDYWVSNPSRNFYLKVYLYDALQGNIVSTKQYRAEAEWQYGEHDKADLHSKTFWKKDYGQAIIGVLDKVNNDLTKYLKCKQPTAKIISVKSNSVQINLGSRNGIEEGQVLTLFYSSNYKDQFGIERKAETQSQDAMQVVEVHETSAILRTLNNHQLGNIQLNDLARIK